MPIVSTEGRYPGEWLLWEEDNFYSREKVTVAAGSKLDTGTVLGRVTDTGKVVQLDPAGEDGSESAYGILFSAVDASDADAEGVAIVRHAIVDPNRLVWPSNITQAQKNAALSALAEKGIIARS